MLSETDVGQHITWRGATLVSGVESLDSFPATFQCQNSAPSASSDKGSKYVCRGGVEIQCCRTGGRLEEQSASEGLLDKGWPVGITAGVKPKERGLGFFNKPHWLGN